MHGGDEMCRQRRYNLSPATNCAGATKCAVTTLLYVTFLFRADCSISSCFAGGSIYVTDMPYSVL